MTVLLIVVLCLAIGGIGVVLGVVLAGYLRGGNDAAAVDQVVLAALAQFQANSAGERQAAIRAAAEHAAVASGQVLSAQRDVIDSRLDHVRVEVRDELNRVSELVRQLGSSSARQFGAVSEALANQAEVTAALGASTQSLREALSSPKARGQWGERMAEDILRLAGFVENVNYLKQTAIEGGRGLPDFTFPLPKGHVLYMDVKFPLSAYLRTLESTTEHERQSHRAAFLRDVRIRVRELSARDYSGNSGAQTVDYVLMFLPNEGITGYIYEHDPQLLDDALKQKVVLCSPLTLFAMLGVIRQAFDNFMVEQTSTEILKLLGGFNAQWGKFTHQIDKLGRQLESGQRAFEELNGVRRRGLERSLGRLEELRQERGITADGELDPGAALFELGA